MKGDFRCRSFRSNEIPPSEVFHYVKHSCSIVGNIPEKKQNENSILKNCELFKKFIKKLGLLHIEKLKRCL